MASTAGGANGLTGDALEVGCLSVQVVGARNVKIGGGGMVDMFLNPRVVNPYCKVTLGVRIGVQRGHDDRRGLISAGRFPAAVVRGLR